MENAFLFIFICSTNILVRLLTLTINKKNSLTPKIAKMCDPILVTLENVTSGTSPLASYKAVASPTHPGLILYNQHVFKI